MYMGNFPPAKKKENSICIHIIDRWGGYLYRCWWDHFCVWWDHFATCDFKFGYIYMLGTQLYHILASNANKYKYKALGHARQCLISNYMPTKQIDPGKAIFKNNLTKIVFWLFLNKKRRYWCNSNSFRVLLMWSTVCWQIFLFGKKIPSHKTFSLPATKCILFLSQKGKWSPNHRSHQ